MKRIGEAIILSILCNFNTAFVKLTDLLNTEYFKCFKKRNSSNFDQYV